MSTHAEREIASQPEVWAQTADFFPSIAHLLPKKGERVAAVGCGSSWFMSQAYAGWRESHGHGETDFYTAREFAYNRKYDRIVAISRSGTTTEVVELLGKISTPSVVITAINDSPMEKLASETIIMPFADEESVVQTRWATAALGLLRMSTGFDLKSIIKDAEVACNSDISPLLDVEQISFIGNGWTIGLAQEAALKTREAAQFWSEAYPSFDYRHGPMSIAQKGRATWAFGKIDPKLADDIRATGALFESSELDPMAHLIRAQRVAIGIGLKRGLNPDEPRGLARSVILK
jgi:fructoselysine-6-P-deglycase FrlB-like protein